MYTFKNHQFYLAQESDIPAIRRLVNSAYKELADIGLNYTASYQDEKITHKRIANGRAFLLKKENDLLGTVLIKKENLFTNKKSLYVSQLGVRPDLKKQGLGSLIMDFCEDLAIREEFESVQLDTAKPALHLVAWYKKRGYHIVGETKWEGKTYESFIFEKILKKLT